MLDDVRDRFARGDEQSERTLFVKSGARSEPPERLAEHSGARRDGGRFDVEAIDMQRYGGLNLFAVLPGALPPAKAFEELLTSARNLSERLQGALQDERGEPLTPMRAAVLREELAGEAEASG